MTSVSVYDKFAGYDLRSSFEKEPGFITSCPMCGSKLETTSSPPTAAYRQRSETMIMPAHDFTYLHTCPHCGWWGMRESFSDYEYPSGDFDYLMSGILAEWDVSAKSIPIEILTNYLQTKDPKSDYGQIDSQVFEKLIAECLRYEYAPCEVYHVGSRRGEGDRGVDILMIKDDTEWLIQVKRRINHKLESVEAVRMLNGVLLREGKSFGMLITSASSFSRDAKAETDIKTPGAYGVRLIDRGDIQGMIARLPRSLDLELDTVPPWERSASNPNMYSDQMLTLSTEFRALFEPDSRRLRDQYYNSDAFRVSYHERQEQANPKASTAKE